MKKANANLRIELAQYKEMESFAQFSSDLDAETRRQLEHLIRFHASCHGRSDPQDSLARRFHGKKLALIV